MLKTLMSGFEDSIGGYPVATVKLEVGFKDQPHQELLYFAYANSWSEADIDGFQSAEEFFIKQVGINKYGW
jgi:hypothetical protein